MTIEEFNQQIKRHETLKEYSQAFELCLTCLRSPELQEEAALIGKRLIKETGILVMKPGGRYYLNLPLELNLNWILDVAIANGYKEMNRGSMSLGLFSSVSCVTIGGVFSKQSFAVKENKDHSVTFFYKYGSSVKDWKLIKALCTDIIDILVKKYHGF